MARFLFLPLFFVIQVSAASAEVCDKFKEDWRIGDFPVLITPFGGWPILFSPVFWLSSIASIGIATLVLKHRCKAAAALWFAGAWVLAAVGAIAIGLAEDPSGPSVIEAAIREGCVQSSWTGGAEFPLICLGFALALGLFGYRRRVDQTLRNEE